MSDNIQENKKRYSKLDQILKMNITLTEIHIMEVY